MKNRQYSLDFIKIVATVFIVFHHYQQFISGVFDNGTNYYGGIFNFGYMVELFFVLSGYFMYPYMEKIKQGLTFKKFFTTRYLRLIPLVAIAAFAYQFLCLVHIKLVGGAAWFMYSRDLWSTIVAALGFQEGWIFTNNTYVNYPIWYVSVLLVCYILFYLGTYLSNKLHVSSRYFYLALLFFGIAISAYGWDLPFMNIYNARGYYSFFTGVLLSTYYFEKSSTKRESLTCFTIITVIIGLIAFKNNFIANGIEFTCTFILYPAIIVLFKNPIINKFFSSQIYQTIANIAFNAYVWQMPLLVALLIFVNTVPVGISFLTRESMWCFAVVNFLIGAISHFLLEKNIKKLIKA